MIHTQSQKINYKFNAVTNKSVSNGIAHFTYNNPGAMRSCCAKASVKKLVA